jgi:hypothetical protein
VPRRLPEGSRPKVGRVQAPFESDFDWSWTEDGPAWVSPAVDTRRPSLARCYDFVLGGKDNYDIDREIAARLCALVPDAAQTARANRAFVLRAVRVMAQAGIRQFLDLGCGIPNPNGAAVHEIAREVVPDARVAYVDRDPIVLAHVRAALDGQPGLYAALFDLRDAKRVLGDLGLRDVVRLDEPVGIIMGAVLNHVDVSLAVQVVDHYLSKIVPDSHIAVSVGSAEGTAPEAARALDVVLQPVVGPVILRTTAQVEELLDGLDLLPPGIVDVTRWRADGVPGSIRVHAVVGVKRLRTTSRSTA